MYNYTHVAGSNMLLSMKQLEMAGMLVAVRTWGICGMCGI